MATSIPVSARGATLRFSRQHDRLCTKGCAELWWWWWWYGVVGGVQLRCGHPVCLLRSPPSGPDDEFFEDEQVPLLVVLLNPGFCDPFVDAGGSRGLCRRG